MDSEDLYCHELSRRSVARASLHLGIESMSQDLLDVLSDVLQHYVAKIGKTMAFLVESSGRPSSHSNVLDAIQAVQMTTAPAAYQVNEFSPGEGVANGSRTINAMRSQRSAQWQELAVFCFGSQWEGSIEIRNSAGGGKVGPSALTNEAGWKAPFLEEVPPFPKTKSDRVANPHNLKALIALSLHADMTALEETITEKRIVDIPHEVFTEWGKPQISKMPIKKDDVNNMCSASTDNNLNDDEKTDQERCEPARKKQKVEDQGSDRFNHRPKYLPDFMPGLPETLHAGRSIVDLPINPDTLDTSNSNASMINTEEGTLGVRSSLVELGSSNKSQAYWGSGWDITPKVPSGRVELDEKINATVVPLGRPSHSRVSRILEGSMDAVH
mmetsp:Transcript_5168/g.6009  ORF Transcript_5168/g.6009 Transcript_5168/m.6009 type:complete len:384 (+) Transcript_5168:24-1175(+)